MDHATLVFASVFPVPSLSHTTPTPVATPDPGFIAPGASFGSPFITQAGAGGIQHRTVRRTQAWSTATRFLSLPPDTTEDRRRNPRSAGVEDALYYLLVGEGRNREGEEGLVEWYTSEARLHFASFVKPVLRELWEEEVELQRAWEILDETQRTLEQVQSLYLQPYRDHILQFLHQDASNRTIRASQPSQTHELDWVEAITLKFQRDIHAVFAHCLPAKRFTKTLSYFLCDTGCRLFRLYVRQDGVQPSATPENTKEVHQRMSSLLSGLERVGLGGDNAQKAFAHAMNQLLDDFINSHYLKVDWFSKKSIVPDLRAWVKDGFCPLVELVLECLRCEESDVQPTELNHWQEMTLARLGRGRVATLFDFVIHWNQSLGAILDLKEYLKLDGAKLYLTSSFSQQVSRRLLHAGATTTYILNVYISIIRAFHKLDPKGVLLERVARPIRRYLKEREDTARIIISSLLTDPGDEASQAKFGSGGELSYEIANEMKRPITSREETDEEFNWNDLNWQPLPNDASPDYKKSKVEDVIHFLLTIWDKEDFINELKNILGEHLLRCQDPEYEKEIRLLELIKVRLGDEKLQACEVMLRDVLESKRINAAIRATGSAETHNPEPQTPDLPGPRTPRPRRPTTSASSHQAYTTSMSRSPPGPTLNAQILSSFFWPILRDDEFRVPAQIEALQKDYETRFERIKGMRKLRWMNALGDSTITLEFADRTEEFDHLTPWQVSVVYAFQPQSGEEWVASGKGKKDQGITRNVEQLEDMLQMDEALVRQALAFWVGRSVLQQVAPDTYAVLERLSSSATQTDAAAAAQELAEVQAAQSTTVKSQADLLNERKDVYMSFIIGMLTNQGNLPVMRILMMMRLMVQGGFPFGAEEVKGLLQEMEADGKVVALGGDVWGIRK